MGPCDEYDLRALPRQLTAPIAIAPAASPGVGMLLSGSPPIAASGISREKSVSGPAGGGPDTRTTRTRYSAAAGGRTR